ncbi:MAG: hypothetical protein V4510_09645 [bacterium]
MRAQHIFTIAHAPAILWLCAGALYLLAVVVCGTFIWWGASKDHEEPL